MNTVKLIINVLGAVTLLSLVACVPSTPQIVEVTREVTQAVLQTVAVTVPVTVTPTETPQIVEVTREVTQVVLQTVVVAVPVIVTPAETPVPPTEQLPQLENAPSLVLDFEGSLNGADGERGYGSDGLSFVPGHSGQGVLLNKENTLYYLTENNISAIQGAVEFWLQPLWNGNDNQNYVLFEIGDSWLNRFRIAKDGANNFRFLVWSSKAEYGVACDVQLWVANDWHHVRVTWHNDSISLSLDDVVCATRTFVVMPTSLSPRIYVGSSAQQDLQAQSVIDEFIIYP